MGNFRSLHRDIRTDIFRKYLEFQDRRLLMAVFTNRIKIGICFLTKITKKGYLNVMEWALNESNMKEKMIYSLMYLAVSSGHTHILDFYLEYAKEMDTLHLVKIATKNSNLNVLKWFDQNFKNFDWKGNSRQICLNAFEKGTLDLYFWLNKRGCEIDYTKIAEIAADLGHLNILIWVYEQNENYFHSLTTIVFNSIRNGHIHILKWLREMNILQNRHTEIVKMYATRFKRNDILEWLK